MIKEKSWGWVKIYHICTINNCLCNKFSFLWLLCTVMASCHFISFPTVLALLGGRRADDILWTLTGELILNF